MELTEPLEAAVVAVAQRAELTTPKRTSLPSILPGLSGLTADHAQSGQAWIALLLGVNGRSQKEHKHNHHHRQQRHSLPPTAYHVAKSEAERSRDEQDCQHLQQIAQRRGIFQRVGGINVEEAAAVGAQLFDGNLGSGGAAGDGLQGNGRSICCRGGFKQNGRFRPGKGLHHPLRNQQQGDQQRQRQQDVDNAARHIHPKAAQPVCALAAEAANEGHQHGHAAGRREKVLHCQPQHLRQVAHGGFTAVELPVGVGGKGNGRVEGQLQRQRCPCHRD